MKRGESTDDIPYEPTEDDRIAETEFSFTFTKLTSSSRGTRSIAGKNDLGGGGASSPDTLVTLDLKPDQAGGYTGSTSPV